VQVRRRPVTVGPQQLAGKRGEVRESGLVFVDGELWRAHAPSGEELVPGEEVEVEHVEADGLALTVRPVGSSTRPGVT
jgi:membrane protein implicated in regulation of membrane protease activity